MDKIMQSTISCQNNFAMLAAVARSNVDLSTVQLEQWFVARSKPVLHTILGG